MAQAVMVEDALLWSALLQTLPAMVYRRRPDANFTLLLASDGCRALTGYAPYQLRDNNFVAYATLIHPQDRQRVARRVAAAVGERTPYLCTYRLLSAQAEEKWVLDRGQGVFAEDGGLLYLEGVVLDNTERVGNFHRIEQMLAERTRKLASLYEIFAAATLTADLRPALDGVLRRAARAIEADGAFLHLLAGDDGARLVADHGLSPAATRELGRLPLTHPLIAEAVETGRYRLLLNEEETAGPPLPCGYCREMDAYLGIPIYTGGQVTGVLSLLARDRERFGPEEVELLISVAYQIGALVEIERLQQEVAQLALAEERSRLARELHDAVTQALYSILLFAEAGRRQVAQAECAAAGASLSSVAEIGQQALQEMRLLLHKLRPAALTDVGLVCALQNRLETVEGRVGIEHRLQVSESLTLPAPVEEALYHICQEALNNALKHARATAVTVRLASDEAGQVLLAVGDNGRGFDWVQALAEARGMGLTTMRERAQEVGGQVTFNSAPGSGTVVEVRLPAGAKRRPERTPPAGEGGRP